MWPFKSKLKKDTVVIEEETIVVPPVDIQPKEEFAPEEPLMNTPAVDSLVEEYSADGFDSPLNEEEIREETGDVLVKAKEMVSEVSETNEESFEEEVDLEGPEEKWKPESEV